MAFRRMVRRRRPMRTMRRGRKSYGRRRVAKRSYKKKTYRRKKMYAGGARTGSTEAAKQLAVYLNPFSVATQQPKIPDGSKNFSLGSSFRSQNAFTFTAENTYCTIAVIPTVCTFALYDNHDGAAGLVVDPFSANTSACFSKPDAIGLPTGTSNACSFNTPDLESWRMVSAGVKVSCINNSLGNDGHWQAIRLRQCQLMSAALKTGEGLVPDFDSYPAITTWANDPTYSSGRLKDIGKKSFMLAQNGEHHWRDWTQPGVLDLTIRAQAPWWFDDSFDVVLIRISGSPGTKILINAFGNYEQTFNSESPLNYYMTQTMQVSPATLQRVQNKKKYMTRKAAT